MNVERWKRRCFKDNSRFSLSGQKERIDRAELFNQVSY